MAMAVLAVVCAGVFWVAGRAKPTPAGMAGNPDPDAMPGQDQSVLQRGPDAMAVLDYYANKCASCHGAYGELHKDQIRTGGPDGTGVPDDELVTWVKVMSEQQAQAPLTGGALDAMVAYHRAVRDDRPFVSITLRTHGALAGEVTPGSTVELVAGGKATAAQVTGHRWSVTAPAEVTTLPANAGSGVLVRASLGGRVTELPVTGAFRP